MSPCCQNAWVDKFNTTFSCQYFLISDILTTHSDIITWLRDNSRMTYGWSWAVWLLNGMNKYCHQDSEASPLLLCLTHFNHIQTAFNSLCIVHISQRLILKSWLYLHHLVCMLCTGLSKHHQPQWVLFLQLLTFQPSDWLIPPSFCSNRQSYHQCQGTPYPASHFLLLQPPLWYFLQHTSLYPSTS